MTRARWFAAELTMATGSVALPRATPDVLPAGVADAAMPPYDAPLVPCTDAPQP